MASVPAVEYLLRLTCAAMLEFDKPCVTPISSFEAIAAFDICKLDDL